MKSLSWLEIDSLEFPPLNAALVEPNGLLAVGGDLRLERLLAAYRHGIFPWFDEDQPILWWSPNPRCVLYPNDLHVSKSLRKRLKKNDYHVTFDLAFEDVIRSCAAPRDNTSGTWITSDMTAAYLALHHAGIAHSVEVWREQTLIGGLYGLAIGKLFFGESMFSRESDASKVAMVYLVEQLKRWSYHLIDCQVYNPHLESLGAREISREKFETELKAHIDAPGALNWQIDWDYRSEA